jgi:hypothetical protein
MMKSMKRLAAVLLSCMILFSLAATSVSAAGGETASKGNTMLNGDWKSLDGTWKYENGIFSVIGGAFVTDKKVGLQFTCEKGVRDFTMEYEVFITDNATDNDEVCVSFRTPKDSYLRKGLIVVADKYGYFYNDMVNWNNKTFAAQNATGNWDYNKWHKVKITTKGARVNISVDDGDAVNAVINKVTPGIDAQYDNGYINLVIGSSDGLNALSKGYAQFKNVKMTIGNKVYAYTTGGITRPSTGSSAAGATTNTTTKAQASGSATTATSNGATGTGTQNGETTTSLSGNTTNAGSDAASTTAESQNTTGDITESTSSALTGGKNTDTNNGGWIIGVIIAAVVLALGAVGFVLYKKGIFSKQPAGK